VCYTHKIAINLLLLLCLVFQIFQINNDRKGDNHVNRLNSEEENSLESTLFRNIVDCDIVGVRSVILVMGRQLPGVLLN